MTQRQKLYKINQKLGQIIAQKVNLISYLIYKACISNYSRFIIIKTKYILNFAIIAHIDHGKTTLAYCIMELTQTVSQEEGSKQLLDNMEAEQAHCVTFKSRTVQNFYQSDMDMNTSIIS